MSYRVASFLQMISSQHQNNLLVLLSKNKVCFDCTAKSPTCVNMTVGSFVCMQCAGYLREFGHRIKSVTASTFTPEEVSDLGQKGNDYAAKTWLAVWIESDDPKPDRNQPKKIKEFMKKKYTLKSFYWDGSTLGTKDPVHDSTMVDWSNMSTVIEKTEPKDVSLAIPPIKKAAYKPAVDNSWADFASAFPTVKKNTQDTKVEQVTKIQENILIPNNKSTKMEQDVQLDPFESFKNVNSGKYNAFQDLAGLSLSESAPKLSTSPKKVTSKTLDLSQFVEVSSSNSKKSWENSALDQQKSQSSLSQFELNPFAFDNTPIEKNMNSNDSSTLKSDISVTESPLDSNEWNAQKNNASDEKIHENQSNSADNDPNHTNLSRNEGWNDSEAELGTNVTQDQINSHWQSSCEISSHHINESSSATLIEDNEPCYESGEYEVDKSFATQEYIPYELDSNVWN